MYPLSPDTLNNTILCCSCVCLLLAPYTDDAAIFYMKPNPVDPARLRDSGVRRDQGPVQPARGSSEGAGVGEGVPPWDEAGRVYPDLGCWQGGGEAL